MSVVKEIIQRAVSDETFRELLFSNPDKALSEYELTNEEKALLKGLNAENFDEFAGNLDDRSTKGNLRPGFG
ncbi:MAG: hypothetical protein D6706_10000 [Chloroflexi bacterium]|nr:MAG: hypothetical protein D6706_10000 [Chloroflexota bacterium]